MNKAVYSDTSVLGKCLLHYRPKKKKQNLPPKVKDNPKPKNKARKHSKKRMRRIFRVWTRGTILQIMWILKMNTKQGIRVCFFFFKLLRVF